MRLRSALAIVLAAGLMGLSAGPAGAVPPCDENSEIKPCKPGPDPGQPTPAHDVFGSLDGAVRNGPDVEVRAWAIDPDDGNAYVKVGVGVSSIGGQFLIFGGGDVLANQCRTDVGAAFPAYGCNHGLTFYFDDEPFVKGWRICAVAWNVAGPGQDADLGCIEVY